MRAQLGSGVEVEDELTADGAAQGVAPADDQEPLIRSDHEIARKVAHIVVSQNRGSRR